MAEQVISNTENVTAAAALKNALTNMELPNSGAFTPNELEVSVNSKTSHFNPDEEPEIREILSIKIKDPLADARPGDIYTSATKILSGMDAFKGKVRFESNAEHAQTMRDTLEDLISKGADIPANYLDWAGFKPAVAEEKGLATTLQYYGLKISPDAAAVNINISVPLGEDEHANSKQIVAAIEKNLKDREAEIKTSLVKRIAKYKGIPSNVEESALSEADKAKLNDIREKVQALSFEIGTSEYNAQDSVVTPAQVSINIRSPQQQEAMKDLIKFAGKSEDEKKAIRDSNILNELTVDQLGKALGRSILHSSETANAIFPRIAGRRDMHLAIIKSLTRLQNKAEKEGNTALAEEAKSFLKDDLFQNPDTWTLSKYKKDKRPGRPELYKGRNGEMSIEIELPVGKPYEIIQQLAAMDGQRQPTPATTETVDVAPQDQGWVDKMAAKANRDLPPAAGAAR